MDDDIKNVVADYHHYQAFGDQIKSVEDSCKNYQDAAAYSKKFKYEVWFGEWSLATDYCAHWLGGFNDGRVVPQDTCQWVDCPKTYLPQDIFTNATVDPSIEYNSPFGYGVSGNCKDYLVVKGKCSKDSAKFTDDDVKKIAKCALDSYN
jgi:hypothetical protein